MEIKVDLNKRTVIDSLVVVQLILVVFMAVGLYRLDKKVEDFSTQPNVKLTAGNNQPTEAQNNNEEFVKYNVPPISKNDHTLGKKGAKVEVILYTDVQCPFCARFHPTFEKIVEEYKDQVYFAMRHFPLESIHPQALPGAKAAECAGEQNKFFEFMHSAIAQNDALSADKFKEIAQSLKLNMSKFNSCVESNKYASKVEADIQSGATTGVQGVPATFVNGELISGAYPYETVKALIDKNL